MKMKDLYFFICKDNRTLNAIYKGDNLMGKVVDEVEKIIEENK